MYGARVIRVPLDDGLTAPTEARYPVLRAAGLRARLLGSTGVDPAQTVPAPSVHWPSDDPIQPALHAAAQLRQAQRPRINPGIVRRRKQRGILLNQTGQ